MKHNNAKLNKYIRKFLVIFGVGGAGVSTKTLIRDFRAIDGWDEESEIRWRYRLQRVSQSLGLPVVDVMTVHEVARAYLEKEKIAQAPQGLGEEANNVNCQ